MLEYIFKEKPKFNKHTQIQIIIIKNLKKYNIFENWHHYKLKSQVGNLLKIKVFWTLYIYIYILVGKRELWSCVRSGKIQNFDIQSLRIISWHNLSKIKKSCLYKVLLLL